MSLKAFGGIAATVRRPPIVLDDSQLDAANAARLRRLVCSVRVNPPRSLEIHPDELSYALAVDDGKDHFEFRAHEASLTPDLRELIQMVREGRGQAAPP
ncbi:MAG TPA: protealysin inhibitor emfourin [Usitatibacter sp.]|nr:protealysin inhibitor emfourin [Usitatibacter sp.]